jgi:hypothetical protein
VLRPVVQEVTAVRAVVVVESLFGNTYSIAEAVAEGLRAGHPSVAANVVRVADLAPGPQVEADMLIVGAPTHWFGVPSERTLRQYLKSADLDTGRTRLGTPLDPSAGGPRVRDWLLTLRHVSERSATAFDARLARPLSGGAAPKISRALASHGYRLVLPPEGFLVTGMEGPLPSGELERARAWGVNLLVRAHV